MTPSRAQPRHLWLLLLILAMLAACASGALVMLSRMGHVSEARHLAHLRLEELAKVHAAVHDLQAQQRGYLLSGDRSFQEGFDTARAELEHSLAQLRDLYAGDAEGAPRLARMQSALQALVDRLQQTNRIRNVDGMRAAQSRLDADELKPANDELQNLLRSIESSERALLSDRASAAMSLTIISACALPALLVGMLVVILFRREAAARAVAQAGEGRALAALAQANAELTRTHSSVLIAFNEMAYRRDVIADVIYWSGAYREVLGAAAPATTEGTEKWMKRVHPEDADNVRCEFERMRRERSVFTLEYRIQHEDGTWRWVHDRGVPHFDERGELTTVIGVMRDATISRSGQEERAMLARRLSGVLESMSDGFIAVDREWRLQYLNPRAASDLRIDPARIVQQTLWECLPRIPTDIVQVLSAAMTDAQARHFVYFLEERAKWFEVHAYPAEAGLSIFFRDVTEAKLAEQQSQQSKERLELSLAAAEIGYWEAKIGEDAVYLSPQWKHQLGYADHEIENDWAQWNERLHPDERAAVTRALREPRNAGDANLEIEYRLRHRDGDYRWVLTRASQIADARGGIALRGVNIDITQRRQADAELNMAQRRLHEIVSSLNDGFVVLDRNWRYVFANDAAARLLGVSKAALIGQEIWQLFPEARAMAIYDHCQRAMAEREAIEHDQYFAPLSRWYRHHIYPTAEGIAMLFQDVSAQKQLEAQLSDERERYLATFEQPAIGILHMSLDGTVRRANGRICEMLGYTRESIIGLHFRDLTGQPAAQGMLGDFAEPGAGNWTRRKETVFLRRGADPFDGEFTLTLVPGEAHRPPYLICMVQDISDRKLAQAMAEEAGRRASAFAGKLNDAVEQERTRISREIHDELGQALTSLKMDLGWLRRRLAEQLPHGPAQIEERVRYMGRSLDETLNTVRRLATELRPALLDNLGLAAALHAQIRHLAARHDISVEQHLESDLLLSREQATGLYRIAQEALTNVARHSQATQVTARLELEGDNVLMEIRDNGVGFSADKPSAYSLGLIGIAERARLLGGTAQIDSAPGRGTVVRVRLPLPDSADIAAEATHE